MFSLRAVAGFPAPSSAGIARSVPRAVAAAHAAFTWGNAATLPAIVPAVYRGSFGVPPVGPGAISPGGSAGGKGECPWAKRSAVPLAPRGFGEVGSPEGQWEGHAGAMYGRRGNR